MDADPECTDPGNADSGFADHGISDPGYPNQDDFCRSLR